MSQSSWLLKHTRFIVQANTNHQPKHSTRKEKSWEHLCITNYHKRTVLKQNRSYQPSKENSLLWKKTHQTVSSSCFKRSSIPSSSLWRYWNQQGRVSQKRHNSWRQPGLSSSLLLIDRFSSQQGISRLHCVPLPHNKESCLIKEGSGDEYLFSVQYGDTISGCGQSVSRWKLTTATFCKKSLCNLRIMVQHGRAYPVQLQRKMPISDNLRKVQTESGCGHF